MHSAADGTVYRSFEEVEARGFGESVSFEHISPIARRYSPVTLRDKYTIEEIESLGDYSCGERFCACFYRSFKNTFMPLLDSPLEDISAESYKYLYRLVEKEKAGLNNSLVAKTIKVAREQLIAKLDAAQLEAFIYEGLDQSNIQLRRQALDLWTKRGEKFNIATPMAKHGRPLSWIGNKKLAQIEQRLNQSSLGLKLTAFEPS